MKTKNAASIGCLILVSLMGFLVITKPALAIDGGGGGTGAESYNGDIGVSDNNGTSDSGYGLVSGEDFGQYSGATTDLTSVSGLGLGNGLNFGTDLGANFASEFLPGVDESKFNAATIAAFQRLEKAAAALEKQLEKFVETLPTDFSFISVSPDINSSKSFTVNTTDSKFQAFLEKELKTNPALFNALTEVLTATTGVMLATHKNGLGTLTETPASKLSDNFAAGTTDRSPAGDLAVEMTNNVILNKMNTTATAATCSTGTHFDSKQCVPDTQNCQVANGTGSQSWTGSEWGACFANKCESVDFRLYNGACYADTKACTNSLGLPGTIYYTTNGNYSASCQYRQTCFGSTHLDLGACVNDSQACSAGTHLDKTYKACVKNTAQCSVANGTGEKTWKQMLNNWSPCIAKSCSPNYALVYGACTALGVSAGATTPVPQTSSGSMTISCPDGSNLSVGGTAVCTGLPTVAVKSVYWTVNGVIQTGNSGTSMTWKNIPEGEFVVRAFATDFYDKSISSNEIKVTVAAAKLSISCPVNLVEGNDAVCNSASSGTKLTSNGYWTLNEVRQTSSTTSSLSWSRMPAGKFRLRAHATDIGGKEVISDVLEVSVAARPLSIPGTLSITCPDNSQLVVGGSATCKAFSTVPLISGYWKVNDAPAANSNSVSMTWGNLPKGTFKIQGFATDVNGNEIRSNVLYATVSSPKFSISCPTTLFEGDSGTCSVPYNVPLASGYWEVNGLPEPGSQNVREMIWFNVQKGTYTVRAVAKDLGGNVIYSDNVVTVVVQSRPAVCPIPAGYIPDPTSCSAPYTEGKTCRYSTTSGTSGTATCGADTLWH